MGAESLQEFGDFFIAGISGPQLSPEDREFLCDVKPIGILLLGRNFAHGLPYREWLSEYKNLLSGIKQCTGRTQMLITLDHEGGHVVRPPLPITRFPYPALFGKLGKKIASAMAEEVKSLGVNVLWSPDSDIHSNPSNPAIGPRAFGKSAEEVQERILPFYRELSKQGIFGCAKHFPGHGDTSVDSHHALPVVNRSQASLEESELLPFRKMIKAGVPLVMTSHIMFPSIDASYPATLSVKILRDLLRKKLKFSGVVVTDDLEMKAISDQMLAVEGVTQAFRAGVDLFIHARHPGGEDRGRLLAQTFVEALGQIRQEQREEARMRIAALMEKVPTFSVEELPEATFRRHAFLALRTSLGEG